MSVLHAVARQHRELQQHHQQHLGQHSQQEKPESPSKRTVMANIAHKHPDPQRKEKPPHKRHDRLQALPPVTIEDVPFRRQDRRILNSRKKRMMDRKLIKCILASGIFIIMLGGALVGAWWVYRDEKSYVGPFILVGSVLMFVGFLLLFFSIEICTRLKKNVKRLRDPSVDHVKNLHEVKHWIQPELIAYAWGQEGDEINDENLDDSDLYGYDRAVALNSRGGPRALSSKSSFSKSNTVHPSVDEKDFELQHQEHHTDYQLENSPHEVMALTMTSEIVPMSPNSSQDTLEGLEETIPKDIFDESLRYSNIDRPKFITIEQASPTHQCKQIKGEFVPEEEKIANLFSPKKKQAV